MVVKNIATGEELEAVIEPVTTMDFKVIKKNKEQFDKFLWEEYKDQEVYKLHLKDEETILGLICITDHTDLSIDAIEIRLLESSAENIGIDKKIDFIGGCLIAFACREAFKRGHEGCVFLVPKTELIEHYSAKYGFQHFPISTAERPEGILTLFETGSQKLIKKYLE